MQEVPTGGTLDSARRDRQWRAAGIVAAVVFAGLVLLEVDIVWSALIALIVGGMVAAPLPVENVVWSPGGRTTFGPWRPTEAEREKMAVRKAMPLYRAERRVAELRLRPDGQLRFVVRDGDKTKVLVDVGLRDFDGLELGTREEWFANAAERQVEKIQEAPAQWVIVAITRSAGVQCIAVSGKARGEMAMLHQALVDEFIGKRREIERRIENGTLGLDG